MLDAFARTISDPPLNKAGNFIAQTGLSANTMTVLGFGFGVTACVSAMTHYYIIAFICLLINRLFDGLDGAVARANNNASDFGGYLDIVLDFFIYAGFPFLFAVGLNNTPDLMASSFVIFAIVTTGVSFLAYAIIAAKRDMTTAHQGKKSFYFSNGLMEGTETIIFMLLLCLVPQYFAMLCVTFGILCLITTVLRVHMAYQVFK